MSMAPGDEARPSTMRRNLPRWPVGCAGSGPQGRVLHTPPRPARAQEIGKLRQTPKLGAGPLRMPSGARNGLRMPRGRLGRTPVRPTSRSSLRRPFRRRAAGERRAGEPCRPADGSRPAVRPPARGFGKRTDYSDFRRQSEKACEFGLANRQTPPGGVGTPPTGHSRLRARKNASKQPDLARHATGEVSAAPESHCDPARRQPAACPPGPLSWAANPEPFPLAAACRRGYHSHVAGIARGARPPGERPCVQKLESLAGRRLLPGVAGSLKNLIESYGVPRQAGQPGRPRKEKPYGVPG